MRKRSPETENRALRRSLRTACAVLDLVARPETRQRWHDDAYVSGMAKDAIRGAEDALARPSGKRRGR